MLFAKNRRRCDKTSLLALHRRFKHYPERHFRLAEADVAADKTVDDLSAFHLLFYLCNSPQLVVRFLVFESVLKPPLIFAVGRVLVPLYLFPLGIESQKVDSEFFDGFFYLFLFPSEILSA